MTDAFTAAVAADRYTDAPNHFITAGKTQFAYRKLGPRGGVPLVLLNHWGAVLDNFDPRIVDLLGFSLGGFVAQDITLKAPDLVRKLILTGTGPAGGAGIERVGAVSWPLIFKGIVTFRDPKTFLFFTSTNNGRRAANDFLARLKERKINRDKRPTPRAFLRQLSAIKAWGRRAPQDLGRIHIPVLVAHGDNDIMVPTTNSRDMARRILNAELEVYEDAGHGGIFQYHAQFVPKALSFLAA